MELIVPPPGSQEICWFDDDNRLEVFFGSDGKVWASHKRARFHVGPSTWKRRLRQLMHWLGLDR
jgi:hypothetical protein